MWQTLHAFGEFSAPNRSVSSGSGEAIIWSREKCSTPVMNFGMWQSTQRRSSWNECSFPRSTWSWWHCAHCASSSSFQRIANFFPPCMRWQEKQLMFPFRKHALWLCVEPW